MEIIKNFGIDPVLLGAQIVNFLIVLYILRRFLYKPILDTLQKRRESIKQGLEASDEARVRLEKVVEKEKKILNNAHVRSQKLIDYAKKETNDLMQKTKNQAKIQADRILNQARLQITIETKEAEKRLASNISQLGIEFIQKSARSLFGSNEQEIVMKNVLQKFKKKID